MTLITTLAHCRIIHWEEGVYDNLLALAEQHGKTEADIIDFLAQYTQYLYLY
jgi:hypothetical protein